MNNEKRISVCVVSIFPPIIGGVSTHSWRLSARLSHFFDIYKINLSGINTNERTMNVSGNPLKLLYAILTLRFQNKVKLFHFHTSRASLAFIICCIPLKLTGAKIILSIHTGRPFVPWLTSNKLRKKLILTFYSYAQRIVFMNEKEMVSLKALAPYLANKLVSASPYVSPEFFVPKSVYYKGDTFRIAVMGLWYPQYNYEMVINVIQQIVPSHNLNVSLSLIVSTANELSDYKNQILDLITSIDSFKITLQENVIDTYECLYHHDLFIRPSLSDSYGLCVAESLYVGTPAIATNVCKRAKGAVLFQTGDNDRLKQLILQHYDEWKNQPSNIKESLLDLSEDSFNKILSLYNDLMKDVCLNEQAI